MLRVLALVVIRTALSVSLFILAAPAPIIRVGTAPLVVLLVFFGLVLVFPPAFISLPTPSLLGYAHQLLVVDVPSRVESQLLQVLLLELLTLLSLFLVNVCIQSVSILLYAQFFGV